MKFIKQALAIGLFSVIASCSKERRCNDPVFEKPVTKSGTLRKQGFTTYQYGTHVLEVSATERLVLSSQLIDLDNHIGSNVIISAVNTHHTVEDGPELYNVIAVVSR